MAHSVQLRLLMEKQHRLEIGQRIRELRENSAETNRSIADYCDVGERSVAGWVAGDGISYKNAKKVAKLFSVSVDWLWRGEEKGETPDLLGSFTQLDRIESLLHDLLDRLEAAEAGQEIPSDDEGSDQPARRSSRRSSAKAKKRASG